jgi:hypothetical protein
VGSTEEILLYDFNAILSAVGGSLGLFLGVSCYTFCIAGLEMVMRRKIETK